MSLKFWKKNAKIIRLVAELFNVLSCNLFFINIFLYPNFTDQAMVDDLRTLCLSKDDFNVINTIGRGHFGQVSNKVK